MYQFIAAVALTLAFAFAFRPRPQNVPPPLITDIQLPNSEQGRAKPVLFGCRYLKGYVVVWWGDFLTKAIKVKGGK